MKLNILCLLIGHKGTTKCNRCAFTFSLPEYINPPTIPISQSKKD